MNTYLRRVIVCATFVLVVVGYAHAQSPSPDGSLWTTVFNPNGARIIPVVYYDPATGILSMDTRGVDRVANNVSAAGQIQGDDVGMITLLVTSPVGATQASYPFDSPDLENPIGWSSQYFAGKQQLIGTPLISQYVLPRIYDVYRFPLGTELVGADVEMAVNFAPLQPGAVLFGHVQMIPEPSLWIVFGSVLVGWHEFRRR